MNYNYKGIPLTLTQEAHQDVPLNADYDWMAHAKDEQGNEYSVTWQQYEDFEAEDASNACDWDDYTVIKL